ASELYIIPASGATAQDPPRNITRFATANLDVTWSKTGNKIAFISQRLQNTPSAYVLSLQKPSVATSNYPPGAASKDIDWDGIHLRVKQPSAMNINHCAIAGDGTRVACCATVDGQQDLWVASSDGGQVLRLTSGNTRPTHIRWSRLFPSQ